MSLLWRAAGLMTGEEEAAQNSVAAAPELWKEPVKVHHGAGSDASEDSPLGGVCLRRWLETTSERPVHIKVVTLFIDNQHDAHTILCVTLFVTFRK